MDFCKTEEEYFCVEGWTGEIRLKWLGKIEVLARRGHGSLSPMDAEMMALPRGGNGRRKKRKHHTKAWLHKPGDSEQRRLLATFRLR